jgi:hypothetical protein
MSKIVATITNGLFWSVANVACFAVYTATMLPFIWSSRKLGVGVFERKDRSARKLTIPEIDPTKVTFFSNSNSILLVYPRLFTEDGEYGHHRYIDLGEGKKFHVVESGNTSGPLVLFLHGFPQVGVITRTLTMVFLGSTY